MSSDAHQIDPQDASLLIELFKASESAKPWVEVNAFRHAHVERRKDIDRLNQMGFIRKERIGEQEFYCLSLTVLKQLGEHPAFAEIQETANSMWQSFREHFKKSSSAPVTLRTISDLIGKPLDQVTLVHTYMREWWHTPHCHTPADAMYQSVIVNEHVFDHSSFDDCIRELSQFQLTGLHTVPNGFRVSSALIDSSEAPAASSLPAFVEPSWFDKLPQHAQALMREMHVARHSGLVALTAMGIRAVIDVVADHLLGAAGWSFAKKLTALSESGHLTQMQYEALSAVVEVGHAAAHRAHVPSERDVLMMFEVLNHVLCSAYGLQNTPAELKARTPPKPYVAKGSKASKAS
jgi:hypothetical protein